MSNVIYIEWDEREAIKHALRQDGMSAQQLAEKIDMDASKLSRIVNREQKNLPIAELRKIAEGQGRPLSYYTDDVEVVVKRLNPESVVPLTAPLGRRIVDYGNFPWFDGPIDIPDLPDTLPTAS